MIAPEKERKPVHYLSLQHDSQCVNSRDENPVKFLSIFLIIEMINNKARHNLIDAKCRWCSDRLDGTVSFWELAGSNESDANLPEEDTKLFKTTAPGSLLFLFFSLINSVAD